MGTPSKPMKEASLSSLTVHGLVGGRLTKGSAVTGFEEPTCGAVGTRTTWACPEGAHRASGRIEVLRKRHDRRREAATGCKGVPFDFNWFSLKITQKLQDL